MRPLAASVRAAATPDALWRAQARIAALGALLERRYRVVLGVILVAQWGGALAVALAAKHNGWLYYHGGDGTWYWTTAHALGDFTLPRSAVGYAVSMVWSPVAAVLGASLLSGLPFIVLFNVVVLLPLVPLLLYAVGERIAGRHFGLLAAASWVIVPALAYRGFEPSYHARLLDNFLPGAIGLNGLADFPSLIVCLASAYFALRAIDNRALSDAAAAGLLAGLAIAVKPANALFLPAPALGLLVARRYPQLGLYAVGILPAALTLALWKQRGLGDLPVLSGVGAPVRLASSQLPLGSLPDLGKYGGIHWSTISRELAEIREVFWSKALLEWGAIAGTFGLLRRSFAKGLVIVAWFAAYFLVKGGSSLGSVYATSFFRLLEPAYGPYLLFVASTIWLLWPARSRRSGPADPPRPLGRRTLVALVVVAAVVPLVFVSAARPASPGAYSVILSAGTYVPVAHWSMSAHVDGQAVQLGWSKRASAIADVAYRVYRSSSAGQDCALSTAGTPDCYLYSGPTADTTATSFTDHPGKGRWVYRVALTASYDGNPADGDPLLLSPPATVTVP